MATYWKRISTARALHSEFTDKQSTQTVTDADSIYLIEMNWFFPSTEDKNINK